MTSKKSNGKDKMRVPSERTSKKGNRNIKYLFDETSVFGVDVDGTLGGGEDFFGEELGDDVVVVHLHAEAASALGDGGEGGSVGEHLGHGNLGADDGSGTGALHALHATAAAVEIAHEGSGEFVGDFDFDAHDGLEERGLGLLHALAEGEAGGES